MNESLKKYDFVAEYSSTYPKTVDPLSTTYLYYVEALKRKAMSLYEITGAPDTWDIDYILETMISRGYICVTDTAVGVVPLRCGYTGINIYNHPTTIIVANPVLGNFKRTIDEDGVLIKLQPNYRGILNIINKYAVMLAECDAAISVNLMNSKVAFIGLVGSKAQAESMKLMYDKISRGEPAVFVRGDAINNDNILYNHVKENFIASDVQLLKRKIMSEFLTEIGVNNANTDKRERLTDDEVNANNSEIQLNSSFWLDNMREGFNRANKMFNLNVNISVKPVSNTETLEVLGGANA